MNEMGIRKSSHNPTGGVILTWLAISVVGAAAHADDANEPVRLASAVRVEQMSQQFSQTLAPWVDWDAAWSTLGTTVINAYERNGWTSESDLYSLEVILDVGAIPPWQIERRLDRFSDLVADRYLLDQEQRGVVRQLLESEANHLLQQHANVILPIAAEGLKTWAAGKPFTQDQLARWTRMTAPAFDDVRARLDVATGKLMESLSEEQQAWLREDLAAARKRIDRVEELRAAIEQGEYHPADWGLPRPDASTANRPATASPETPKPTTQPTVDQDPWARHVRQVIRQYRLNETQQAQAWRIYRRLCTQREFHDERAAERLKRLAAAAKESPQRFAPRITAANEARESIRARLFDVLKRRLERLPTRAQRATAGE